MSNNRTTWRECFNEARKPDYNSDRLLVDETPIVAVAPEGIDLDKPFNAGYGGSEGEPVLIWTEDRVYFPVVYDGAEWMGSAPRNPTSDGQRHVGGE